MIWKRTFWEQWHKFLQAVLLELQQFNFRGCIYRKFSAPLAAILFVGCEKVLEKVSLEVKNSPCQIWWGLDFARCQGEKFDF